MGAMSRRSTGGTALGRPLRAGQFIDLLQGTAACGELYHHPCGLGIGCVF